jgi:hypothetical protein
MRKEDHLSTQVAKYLQYQYPNVIYHFDLSSGGKKSIGMAVRDKSINKWRGYPDLFICQPVDISSEPNAPFFRENYYNGLFIEIKAETIYLKDNVTLKSDKHIQEQSEMLKDLQKRGYMAEFVIGFDHIKLIIDSYLKNT